MTELARQLPRLQAEEALHDAMVISLGTGTMRKADRESAIRDLRRAAHERRRPARTTAEFEMAVAELGLGLAKVSSG